MSRFDRILCPVDMSKNSFAAIRIATGIAKQNGAQLIFMHVAPTWKQNEPHQDNEIHSPGEELALQNLRPTDESVEFEHLYLRGNAGPEIVRQSERCDLVVIGTHGHSGMARHLVGGVAEYVIRHARCQVITVKSGLSTGETEPRKNSCEKRYVTEAMHQIAPVHEYDLIEDVILELERANETAAPVVNKQNETIGILTQTDIARYLELRQRLAQKDPSVISEVYEVNQFGNYRVDTNDFEQVKKHMSSPARTIKNTQDTDDALDIFATNAGIHHLVVVDTKGQPLGILAPKHCSTFHQLRRQNATIQDAKTP